MSGGENRKVQGFSSECWGHRDNSCHVLLRPHCPCLWIWVMTRPHGGCPCHLLTRSLGCQRLEDLWWLDTGPSLMSYWRFGEELVLWRCNRVPRTDKEGHLGRTWEQCILVVNTLIDFLSLFGFETESCIAQAVLEAPILSPQLPKFWDYRCAPS